MTQVIDVVIPSTIDQTFSYLAEVPLSPGQRVAVPFGRANRLTEAFVVACPSTKEQKYKLKTIKKVIDDSSLLTEGQWRLADWLSRYYIYPLADILKAMLPGALSQQADLALTPAGLKVIEGLKPLISLKKKQREGLLANAEPTLESSGSLGGSAAILEMNFRQIPLAAEVLSLRSATELSESDPIYEALTQLAAICAEPKHHHQLVLALVFVRKPILRQATARAKLASAALCELTNQPASDTISLWLKASLVAPHTELGSFSAAGASSAAGAISPLASSAEETESVESAQQAKTLTAKQQQVFNQLVSGLALELLGQTAPKPALLHGITGSGKTELYLQLIARLRKQHPSAQTLVLVPEIGLTPQMETRFAERFPGEVALVHSALSKEQRWQRLAAIKEGQQSILIGPRSAVLAGFADLKLLIVDEEHDTSYKQGSGFLYHGRDVAIVRAMQHKAAVVLGSATPSLESYQNALSGRYSYLDLLERATGMALPDIKVIKGLPAFTVKESVQATAKGRMGKAAECYVPIAPAIIEAIKAKLELDQQVMVIVNRKGYSCYLMTKADKEPVCCPHCAITLKVYNHNQLLRCHYCDYRITVAAFMAKNPAKEYLSVGYGSDKVFDYLCHSLGPAVVAAVDADTPKREFNQSLKKFREGDVQVLVGTQILAKGHDFPKVTLTVVLEIDHLLNLPDFRGGERTFQLLVQAAGRSGRAKLKGEVLFQTLQPAHPVISAALSQDFVPFAKAELHMREDLGFPPFARLITMEFLSTKPGDLAHCQTRVQDALAAIARDYPELKTQLTVSGPSAPPIEKVRGRHRLTLLMRATDHKPLWQMVALLRHHLDSIRLPSSIIRKIDVDPQSLL